jgi:hypothetical protein
MSQIDEGYAFVPPHQPVLRTLLHSERRPDSVWDTPLAVSKKEDTCEEPETQQSLCWDYDLILGKRHTHHAICF